MPLSVLMLLVAHHTHLAASG